MLARGKGTAVIDRVLSLVIDLERENERFAWRLLRELRYRFGRQAEKLSREELAQFFLALGGDESSAKNAELVVPVPERPSESETSESEAADENKPEPKSRGNSQRASREAASRSPRLSSDNR